MAGMTHAKIAVTLPEDLVAAVRRAVKEGHAKSVSGYIAKAVTRQVRDSELEKLLEEMLAETGGPLTAAEKKWADGALGLTPLKSKRKR
jgi:Arc/MetJ-type ribon-helix-helix transcriptional regulator